MDRADRTAFGIGGVGFAANVIAMSLPQVWPGAPWWLWYGLFGFGVLLLLGSVMFLITERMFKTQLSRRSFVLAIVALIAGGVWHWWDRPSHRPLSLVEVYVTDFPQYLSQRRPISLSSEALNINTIVFASKYYDYDANAFFLSVYIPRDEHLYEICAGIANQYRDVILKRI